MIVESREDSFEAVRKEYVDYLSSLGYQNLIVDKSKSKFVDNNHGGEQRFTVWMNFHNKDYRTIIIFKGMISSEEKLSILRKKYPEDIIENKDGYFCIISKDESF